jgi:hypothetical protein
MKIAPVILVAGATILLAVSNLACKGKAAAVNPAGTWEVGTSNVTNRPPSLLILKMEGDKLSGTLSRNAGTKVEQLPLEDAQLKGGEIAFAVHVYALVYEHNVLQPTDTNKVTLSKYQGQISGDAIKGTVEKKSWMEDSSRTNDWEATRVKQ